MTLNVVDVPGIERFTHDDVTGTGVIEWRAGEPPRDVPVAGLDDHFLGARLVGPCKPWLDTVDNVQMKSSPGSLHAIHADSLLPWPLAEPVLYANAVRSLARPVNYLTGQVCMGGGRPPCSKSIPIFHWEPQHEFRGLRHLIAWRRFGWPSDRFLAECAISRVVNEPTLYDVPKNQREVGWPLLLLAEALGPLNEEGQPDLAGHLEAAGAIQKITGALWLTHGDNYLTLNTAAGKDHGYLPVCSWQHAVLTRALGRLVRRKWPDPRVAVLYKAGLRGLDAMRDGATWAVDWDPATGSKKKHPTPFNGTSKWAACAYAESLGVVDSMAADRRDFLRRWMGESAAMNPQDNSNYDPAAHALLGALVGVA